MLPLASSSDNVLEATDYRDVIVVFTKKKWEQKSQKHPWLLNKQFLSYVEEALVKPTEVWEDYNRPKNIHCYYYRYGINMWAKVVVWVHPGRNEVVTAFDYTGIYFVKESKYPELRRIYES